MLRTILGRLSGALFRRLIPRWYDPAQILADVHSEWSNPILLARAYGVETQFKPGYLEFAKQCVVEQYARHGVKLTFTTGKKEPHITVNVDKPLSRWVKWSTTKVIYKSLWNYWIKELSLLSGRKPESVRKSLKRLGGLGIIYIPSKRGLMRAVSIWEQFPNMNMAAKAGLLDLILVGLQCEYCDIKPSEFDRYRLVAKAWGYGSHAMIHFLICRQQKLDTLGWLVQQEYFSQGTKLPGAGTMTPRTSRAVGVSFSIERVEALAEAVKKRVISRKFLAKCLLDYAIPVTPEEAAELKELVDEYGWLTVAAYYHRRIPVSQIRSAYGLVSSGLLSFYDARLAVEAGVIPEIASLLKDKRVSKVEDIISIHNLVERFGLEEVGRTLDYFGSDLYNISLFWSIRARQPGLSWDQVCEAVTASRQAAPIPLPERPRVLQGSRKRSAQRVETVQELPLPTTEVVANDSILKAWYVDVSVSEFPVINGNAWLRLLRSCGWKKESQRGSHASLRKGPWRVTFVCSGSYVPARYTLFDGFRQSRVPEEEVRLILDTWNSRRSRKPRNGKTINHL